MRVIASNDIDTVSGGGLPAVIIYAVARKALVAGAKKYAKSAAGSAASGAVGGSTTAVLTNND